MYDIYMQHTVHGAKAIDKDHKTLVLIILTALVKNGIGTTRIAVFGRNIL